MPNEGRQAEKMFAMVAHSKGFEVKASTGMQDAGEHWDILMYDDIAEYRVDVKAQKRSYRYASDFLSRWLWIELQNVHGQNGWLYGKADLLAFEQPQSFLLVRRRDIVDFVDKYVNLKEVVDKPWKAKYKVYTRVGRSDIITLIEKSKLPSWSLWEKVFVPISS